MIRAKLRKASNMMSSLSKREEIRRKPFSRRKRRSTWFRLRYIALSYCQGSRRWLLGGTTGIQRQLPGRIVFVGALHEEIERRRPRSDAAQKFTACHGVGSFAGGERESYGRSSLRGHQMNLGAPSAA